MTDHIPSFEAQPEFIAAGGTVTRIDNELLSGVPTGARFNGSIVEWKGRMLMAYRQYNPNRKMQNLWPAFKKQAGNQLPQARDIGITVLDKDWNPRSEHTTVVFPIRHGDECFEDPRLFIFNDSLWLGVCYFLPQQHGCLCHQHLYRLNDDLQIEHGIKIYAGKNLGGNRDWEKNWTYFENDLKIASIDTAVLGNMSAVTTATVKRLILLYNVSDMQTHEINPKTGKVERSWIDRRLFWPFGHMRGGTSPVELSDGTYLKFVHSSTDHEWSAQGGTRRYSMSAVIFDSQPPFKILKVSKLPIAWGSRHEAFCGHGNSQCVFPAGTVIKDGRWHVSAGVNDTFNAIFHLDPAKVLAGMVDATEFYEARFRYFFTTSPAAVATIAGRDRLWRTTKAAATHQEGILATQDPFTIGELLASATARELTKEGYEAILASVEPYVAPPQPKVVIPDFKNPVGPKNIPSRTTMPAETPKVEEVKPAPVATSPGYNDYDAIAHYLPKMEGWGSVNKGQRIYGDMLATSSEITVDLGAFGGRIAMALAFAHRRTGIGVVHAIDAWSNEVAAKEYTGENKEWWSKLDFIKIYTGFLRAIDAHHVNQWVKVHRMKCEDAVKLFEDGTVGVLSFDADHSEASSLRDIRDWMPKMKDGGLIYFDDTDWAENGVCTTAKAQQVLLDAGWVVIHTEPKNPDRGEGNEWKIFQKPRAKQTLTPEQEFSAECCGQCQCEAEPVGDTQPTEILHPENIAIRGGEVQHPISVEPPQPESP